MCLQIQLEYARLQIRPWGSWLNRCRLICFGRRDCGDTGSQTAEADSARGAHGRRHVGRLLTVRPLVFGETGAVTDDGTAEAHESTVKSESRMGNEGYEAASFFSKEERKGKMVLEAWGQVMVDWEERFHLGVTR
ncbi:hypothetical protein GW17_00031409 [Ensete ventricosum]|nr:hypothetical protein GW17_00031409 [Ensete ventricosum]